MLALRRRPIKPFLMDGSAAVTGVLLGLTLPPLAPWWIPVTGTAFAIIIAKQLFGGLGYNPFNPAMVGYAMLLISFPRQMTMWMEPLLLNHYQPGFADTLSYAFSGAFAGDTGIDAVTMATPLDTLKTQLRLNHGVEQIMAANPLFGSLGGKGWEWVNMGFLAGGLWLLYKKIITWHIPAAVLAAMAVMATVFHLAAPHAYASPLFHLASGATMLGAFFIATDPVTASTTPRGRLLYGIGIGVLIYVIRTWGGYPDGVAFAVLLMNMVVPTIDYYTQPRVFGHKD
jgi:electron transport complex protein RnfD